MVHSDYRGMRNTAAIFGRPPRLIASMKNKLLIIAGVLVVTGAAAAGTLYAYWDQAVPLAGMTINYFRSWSAPSGTTTTELAAASKDAGAIAASPPSAAPLPSATTGD